MKMGEREWWRDRIEPAQIETATTYEFVDRGPIDLSPPPLPERHFADRMPEPQYERLGLADLRVEPPAPLPEPAAAPVEPAIALDEAAILADAEAALEAAEPVELPRPRLAAIR